MSRQLISMGMGMSVMPERESRFYLRMVGRMGMQMIHLVVPVLFLMTPLVLAGL